MLSHTFLMPDMSRDLSGKLLVGAAVPAKEGEADEARAYALAEAIPLISDPVLMGFQVLFK